MNILYIIIYISIAVWLLPPFRQYKGNYFFYFLILALSDPVSLAASNFFGVYGQNVHSISAYLMIISLIYFPKNSKPKMILVIPMTLIFISGYIYIDNLTYLLFLLHILILIVFLKRTLILVYKHNTINLFYWVLLFYEVSLVINIYLMLEVDDIKVVIYYATLFFQIFVAIFFTIFIEKSQSIIFKLRQIE
jgi:hypothetical protein